MIWLSEKLEFPSYDSTTKDGIIALGGDLSPERLMYAYQHGIFPWYSENEPIVWYCPTKRMVLFPNDLKVSKSMKSILKRKKFIITENEAFEEVIFQCKTIARKEGYGTWITNEMEKAYIKLHKKGIAKSIEVWLTNTDFNENNKDKKVLVGGLYGLKIGDVFCGESMFTKVSNASKIAFIHLVQSNLYKLIDCQVYNDHLKTLGAKEIMRDKFLTLLEEMR
ncbi:MAG: leucyl/phenylalanyl-tRNA--protein transferase [Flavobacteriaceae bacterium]